jgi:hypothetical protein
VANYQWAVTDAAGEPVARLPVGRCGNVNPITADDFVALEPGKALTLRPENTFLSPVRMFFQPRKAGTYRVTLSYSCDPKRPDRGLGGGARGNVGEMLAGALTASVTSNVLTIEVVE